MNVWIPVSERLPEVPYFILVYTNTGRTDLVYKNDDDLENWPGREEEYLGENEYGKPYWHDGDDHDELVTHWMPCPERPST